MISKIDITKFGLFKNYNWNLSIGKAESFRRVNIIYGRNYSGKTTLARIFKCLEDNMLHKHYQDCDFLITLENGQLINNNNLGEFGERYKIRVYNTDFVKENLSWLHNEDGTIEPFTILGSKNVEIDQQINDLNGKLGNAEKGLGLLGRFEQYSKKLAEKNNLHIDRQEQLEDKLRKRANDVIKVDSNMFLTTSAKKTYTINDIKNEIRDIGSDLFKSILTEEQKDEKLKLLKETALDDLGLLSESKPNFVEYYEAAKTLVEQKIKPNMPITELINDSLLQEWVYKGIDKHKGKRQKCGFCGNVIPPDLWNKLDAHFSKESEDLRIALQKKISLLQQSQKSLDEFFYLKKEEFYTVLHPVFDSAKREWDSVKNTYSNNLEKIILQLHEREKDIFREKAFSFIADVSESLSLALKQFNSLISKHNSITQTLSKDQEQSRKKLRYHNIAQFLIDIEYYREREILEEDKKDIEKMKSESILLSEEIRILQAMKRALETQTKDESKGAELVNQHLTHFFGHDELKLIAESEETNVKFRIHRDAEPANNLSEGECSLISFCYFIAKMEDELNNDADQRKLLIYIDDPISSLDTNHIFFMFSLIESIIGTPQKYGQLFISTHNLDFLKYLKRLTVPKFKVSGDSKEKKDIKHFIIERKSKGESQIKSAPSYLKDYITEFNYLFDEILKCSNSDPEEIKLNHQYNFGNNMRKFLEAYLFYKYPTQKMTNDQKLRKYFKDDLITVNLINRVINEYSHIGEQFERGMEPIDIDEIKKISKAVIERIQETDQDQYDALLQSVA